MNIANEIEITLKNVFVGTPGFATPFVVVTGFVKISTAPVGRRRRNVPMQLAGYSYPYTNASYTTHILMTTGMRNVSSYINSEVIYRFSNVTINGTDIDANDTINNMTGSIAAFNAGLVNSGQQEVCGSIGDTCPSCYSNCTYDTTALQPACWSDCPAANHRFCSYSGEDSSGRITTECLCQPGYLPVGGGCTPENLVIGLSAGLGGALVLGLAIAIFICAMTRKSTASGADAAPFYFQPESKLLEDDVLQQGAYDKDGKFGRNGLSTDMIDEGIISDVTPKSRGQLLYDQTATAAEAEVSVDVAAAPAAQNESANQNKDEMPEVDYEPVGVNDLGEVFLETDEDHQQRLYRDVLTEFRDFKPRLSSVNIAKDFAISRPQVRPQNLPSRRRYVMPFPLPRPVPHADAYPTPEPRGNAHYF
jgi:hypothetical protein